MPIAAEIGSSPAQTRRIPSLDGLRGAAILMVLLGHAARSLPPLSLPVMKYVGNAQLGVSVFFTLSGFLIYHLSVREVEKSGAFSWKDFYVRRMLRIFPCFYLYITALLLLTWIGKITLTGPMMISAATFSLNYLPAWYHADVATDYVVIGHYWTLALEEQFYLTWPLVMLLFARRKLLPLMVAIVALAPGIRVASYFFAPGTRGQIPMMFHTGFDAIAGGVLLGELLRRASSRRWLERLAANRLLVGGLMVFLVFLSPWLRENFRGAYDITIGRTLDLASLCIVITAATSFPGTVLFRALNWRPLAYVGLLSYSLYVWNNLFLLTDGHWFNQFPLNLACVGTAALMSYYLVESPFLKLKDRFHRSVLTPASGAAFDPSNSRPPRFVPVRAHGQKPGV